MKVHIDTATDEGQEIIDVHIDKWDTWSLDCTLSYIILPCLKQLKEQKQGVPTQFFEGNTYSEEEFQKAKEKWHATLDKMIFSFQYIVDNEVNGLEDNTIQEGFHLFGQHYTNLWS